MSFGIVQFFLYRRPVQADPGCHEIRNQGNVIFGNYILWKTFRPPSKISPPVYAYVFTHEDIKTDGRSRRLIRQRWAELTIKHYADHP